MTSRLFRSGGLTPPSADERGEGWTMHVNLQQRARPYVSPRSIMSRPSAPNALQRMKASMTTGFLAGRSRPRLVITSIYEAEGIGR